MGDADSQKYASHRGQSVSGKRNNFFSPNAPNRAGTAFGSTRNASCAYPDQYGQDGMVFTAQLADNGIKPSSMFMNVHRNTAEKFNIH
jgi:hypothetical protein